MSRPQHHTAFRVRLTSAALGLGAVVALAGCSAGQVTETDTQVAAVPGGSGDVNGIGVRNATLVFPTGQGRYGPGSSAPLQAVLINSGAQDDKLVQVTSSFANSVQVGQTTELPSNSSLHADGAPAQSGQTSQGAQPSQGGQPSQQQAPSQGSATDERQVSITLNGLTQQITPGVTVPVTFVFAKAGPVTVQVPIGEDSSPRPEHGSGGASHH
ncbi:hypothetical protein [Saccharopolyspora sp. SCSIO 74807]|uniref:hypothetical protein n=1 Tax=Saccharopolyspora sp. SCSIO 74807 TaxID=3118084 RepID=UPI0030D45F26